MRFLSVLAITASLLHHVVLSDAFLHSNDASISTTTKYGSKRIHMASSRRSEDQLIEELLIASRKAGPVGSLATEEEREKVNNIAQELSKVGKGERNPAKVPLRGTHDLVYSAAPGGSSGRLVGPISGKVTQEFLDDDITFINSVKLGPLEICLQAEKEVKNNKQNTVFFRKSIVKLLGNTIVEKDIKGNGIWNYLYMGKIRDSNGNLKLLRVMETPSLFVIEQPIQE